MGFILANVTIIDAFIACAIGSICEEANTAVLNADAILEEVICLASLTFVELRAFLAAFKTIITFRRGAVNVSALRAFFDAFAFVEKESGFAFIAGNRGA